MNKLKLMKIIVFILTFLLIFGMICAGSIVYKKISPKSVISEDISLNQPKGSSIVDYRFNNDKLYLLIKGGNLADRIVVFNPEKQQIEASIKTF